MAEEVAEVKETPAIPEYVDTTCPHCGVDTKQPKIDISEEDKNKWLRYVLSHGTCRFSKSYSVYGGRVRFTLKTRSPLEDRDVDLGLPDVLRDIQSVVDFGKIRIETFKLQLVFSLDSVEYRAEGGVDYERTAYPTFSKEEIQAAWKDKKSIASSRYADVMESIPNPVLGLIIDKVIDFNTICSALTVQGLSENF